MPRRGGPQPHDQLMAPPRRVARAAARARGGPDRRFAARPSSPPAAASSTRTPIARKTRLRQPGSDPWRESFCSTRMPSAAAAPKRCSRAWRRRSPRAGDEVIFAVDDRADADPPAARTGLRPLILPAGHAASTRRLAALLRAERPDASFSALGAQNLKHLAAALLAGRAGHCVLGYHGFAVAEPKPFAQASFRLASVATRIAARTICVSDALLDDLRTRWRASPRRTLRIYNPLPAASGNTGDIAREKKPRRRVRAPRAGQTVSRPRRRPSPCSATRRRGWPLSARGRSGRRSRRRSPAMASAGRVDLPGHVHDLPDWYRPRRLRRHRVRKRELRPHRAGGAGARHAPWWRQTAAGAARDPRTRALRPHRPPIEGTRRQWRWRCADTLASPGDAASRVARAEAFALPTIRAAYARARRRARLRLQRGVASAAWAGEQSAHLRVDRVGPRRRRRWRRDQAGPRRSLRRGRGRHRPASRRSRAGAPAGALERARR